MTIKMLKTAAGPKGTWVAGQELKLSATEERSLVDVGSAEYVGDQPAVTAEREAHVSEVARLDAEEIATEPEAENAAKRTVRARHK